MRKFPERRAFPYRADSPLVRMVHVSNQASSGMHYLLAKLGDGTRDGKQKISKRSWHLINGFELALCGTGVELLKGSTNDDLRSRLQEFRKSEENKSFVGMFEDLVLPVSVFCI